MKILAFGLTVLFATNAFAAEPTPAPSPAPTPATSSASADDPVKSDAHKNRARVLIDQKDWKSALDEIRLATQTNPQSAEAWLIHGTAAMRMESNREALDAFNRYLALSPSADKAAAVKLRVAELEIRVNKEVKAQQEQAAAEAKAKAERFGPNGSGFLVGFSPLYKPKISTDSDLNASMSKSFDFGFKFKMVDVALRLGSGEVEDDVTVKDDSGVMLRTETVTGKYSMWELFSNINIPVNTPEEGKAGIEWAVPIHIGMFMNTVKFSKSYWNMGLNAGTGGLMRYYSGSRFIFDVMALYNLSLPITAIQNNDAKIETVYNAKGKKAAGSLTGFELHAGIGILF